MPDHVIVLGEAHLRHVLKTCAAYYNEIRTHRALGKMRLPSDVDTTSGKSLFFQFLIDFINQYIRVRAFQEGQVETRLSEQERGHLKQFDDCQSSVSARRKLAPLLEPGADFPVAAVVTDGEVGSFPHSRIKPHCNRDQHYKRSQKHHKIHRDPDSARGRRKHQSSQYIDFVGQRVQARNDLQPTRHQPNWVDRVAGEEYRHRQYLTYAQEALAGPHDTSHDYGKSREECRGQSDESNHTKDVPKLQTYPDA